jgi:hypothetical protein
MSNVQNAFQQMTRKRRRFFIHFVGGLFNFWNNFLKIFSQTLVLSLSNFFHMSLEQDEEIKVKQGGFANGVAISDSSAIRVKFEKIRIMKIV